VVDRADAGAEREAGAQRPGQVLLGPADGGGHVVAGASRLAIALARVQPVPCVCRLS
jgi:hypothetical protein